MNGSVGEAAGEALAFAERNYGNCSYRAKS